MGIRNIARLAAACVLSLSAGWIGLLLTPADSYSAWYAALEKPAFTPPGWVFGPVWTVLYLLMGVAAFLVWRRGLKFGAVRTALAWFLVQLILNALWSPVFFGLHRIGLALAVLVLLWAAIVTTLYHFHRVSDVAAWLLVPYLLWVSFALVLNASIWHLNH